MISVENYNPEGLNPAQLWALGLSAILTERNSDRHDIMGGDEREEAPSIYKHVVARDWGIHNREDLLESVAFCTTEGGHNKGFTALLNETRSMSHERLTAYIAYQSEHNASYANRLRLTQTYMDKLADTGVLAWDLGRAVSLCRWGYLIGWFDADEMWTRIRPIAQAARETYPSWNMYAVSYAAGSQYWRAQLTQEHTQDYLQVVHLLLTHPDSPWLRVPWDTPLEAL